MAMSQSRQAGGQTHEDSLTEDCSLYDAYGSSYIEPPSLDAVAEGIRVLVKCLNDGTMPEEQAIDLIKVLTAAYAGALITRQVEDCLERGLSEALIQNLQNWDAVGERQRR